MSEKDADSALGGVLLPLWVADLLWESWVLQVLWQWFVVPLGVTLLSFRGAIGLNVLISFATYRHRLPQPSNVDALNITIGSASVAAMALLIGWLCHGPA